MHDDDAGGYYIEPTVFDGVDNKMTIAQEEIFGPVLSVDPVQGRRAGAVAIANDTIYGLAAGGLDRATSTPPSSSPRALRAGIV